MNAGILTLGCRLNQADSALISARLKRSGWTVLPYSPEADFQLIVLNSCAVTATATRKSRQLLRSLRQKHPAAKIIFTGCSADAVPDLPPETIPVPNPMKSRLEQILAGEKPEAKPFEKVFCEHVLTERDEHTRANLKIQEGCENFCAYCIVPHKRGPERSRDMQEILTDFRHLASLGVPEIVLTGINTCTYNCRGARLPQLLEELLEIPGDFRIRIGSTEPGPVLPGIIDVMASANGRICEFLHPSLQNGCDAVLRRMNRKCFTQEYADYMRYARSKVPNIHIGTDIITGFPGETDAEFEESYEYLAGQNFANIHIFPYSPRKGTPAAAMKPQVPNNISRERAERLHALRDRCAAEFAASLIGTAQTFIPETGGKGKTGSFMEARVEGITAPGPLMRVRVLSAEPDGTLLCKKTGDD